MTDLVETIARELIRARGAVVVANDENWPPTVAHHRQLLAEYPSYADGRSLIHDAFRDASLVLGFIEAAGFTVMPHQPTFAILNALNPEFTRRRQYLRALEAAREEMA